MNRLRYWVGWLWPALLLAAGSARAATPVWADNFETNAASRWQVSAPWKIGSPTAGPAVNTAGYRTHSGANCANTQGYGYNKNVRLVCIRYNGASTLLVPSADQAPRLRFWHWFDFGNATGYVEISTNNGGTWIAISPSLLDKNSGGVWSRPSLDLTPYAGDNILIAFHFISGGIDSNGLGWFVDDVEVDTGAPVLNFPEGFESDPKTSDWSVDAGTWVIGRPTSGPGAAHSGTNCAGTILTGAYENNADTRLISPPFLVPDSSDAVLSYWHWYSFNNAYGVVEINNNTVTTIVTTNTTITTNVSGTLNTNIYQFVGALDTNYAAPFYWNSTMGGWTNATKALGSVLDQAGGLYQYYFQAGTAPLASVTSLTGNVDYRVSLVLPFPQSPAPTNFFALQGISWNSVTNVDAPVGYFGTNYTYTYATNTSIVTSQTTWAQISPTYQNTSGGVWTQASLNLSNYVGQTIQLGFHFVSGGINRAAGWYVDDIGLVAAPLLTVPTNLVVSYGQKLTNSITATNSLEPAAIFNFGLAAPSTNATVTSAGVATWTNTATTLGTYLLYVKVTDNNSPPFSITNHFSVTVLPLPSQFALTNAPGGGHNFKLTVQTPWTNSTWRILAATNLDSGWLPIYTNRTGIPGTILFTDLLATNYLQRYYRTVFP
jgi:hypothetical protein